MGETTASCPTEASPSARRARSAARLATSCTSAASDSSSGFVRKTYVSSGACVAAAMTICPTSCVKPLCVLVSTKFATRLTARSRRLGLMRANISRTSGEYMEELPMR